VGFDYATRLPPRCEKQIPISRPAIPLFLRIADIIPDMETPNPETLDPARVSRQDLLTVEQAAAHLQLSQSSIRSYMRQGKLRAFRVAGLRKVLIPRAELLKLLEPTVGVGDNGSGS
jgi:excisionase family DNA binding protein